MGPVLEALNLSKAYNFGENQVHALKNVSLEVYAGEMVAIVGPEGSGKSTLLHSLACLLRPDSGQVRLTGVDVAELRSSVLARVRAHKVGFLFQAFNLLPNQTVLANVEVSLPDHVMQSRKRRQISEKALRAVGLEKHQQIMPGQLTPEQRLSVVIARELVHDPDVMFADEPTKELEGPAREGVMGLFQKLNSEGMTVIIATPDAEVANYCRRVVRIENGVTTDDGLVERRRIIRLATTAGPTLDTYVREAEIVCPRCNYGNPDNKETCRRCGFPLRLTPEAQEIIRDRLKGEEDRWGGVESSTDEGEVPGQELINELKRIPFFSELGSKTLVKVIPSLQGRIFAKGTTIINQGDPGDSFYIIRTGGVDVLLERAGRPAITVAQLGALEGFGEMALLTGQPRSASVVATSNVEAWCLPQDAFSALLSENVSLALYFNRILTQRLRTLQEEVIP